MFYLTYLVSELRRRKGRTLLTALGLAVGVGLVVTVTALSNGLDDAQRKVLKPLTGVGTDMAVNRPLKASGSGSGQSFRGFGPGAGLSASEQDQLRKENQGARLNLGALKGGSKIDTDNFVTTTQLSFPESEVKAIERIPGVQAVAPALTLSALHVSGTVPKNGFGFARGGAGGGGPRGPGGFGGAPPGGQRQPINFDQKTIAGIDVSKPALGLVTPSQIVSGHYLDRTGNARQAVLSQSYAAREKLTVGDTFTLKGKTYTVVGLAKAPLGGQASDVYIPLTQLQALSGRDGRINVLQVRADNADQVASVSKHVVSGFPGSKVTTAQDLANRVTGSLSDAKSLSDKLGTALAIVALVAAFLIAGLLTLSSVAKRTRELGTLKAIGWRQWLVVRQISGESLTQGALGGVLGALVGVGGAAVITAFAPTLKATVAQAASTGGGGPLGPGGGPPSFGQGQVVSGTSTVSLHAPVDVNLILLAIGLALLGGLVAGTIGGVRAARLRPAAALRSVE